MRREILCLLVLVFAHNITKAQVPVGLKYDCNGYAFNGYYDALTYFPKKKLVETKTADVYEIGAYYDSNGKKVNGYIKFMENKFRFKKTEKELGTIIKPKIARNLVIGVDSFFTITNYYHGGILNARPIYVQYISAFNGIVFARHFDFNKITYSVDSPIAESYIVKAEGSDTWESLRGNKKKFKDRALKYFSHIPYLKENILLDKYTHKDMMSLIKMAEYQFKFEQSEMLFFDKYWQETRRASEVNYSAKIVAHQDSIWTIDYYLDSIRLYTVNYSSFYPNNKNGQFTAFYSDGSVRQKLNYKNDKVVDVQLFNENGFVDKHYSIIKGKDERGGKASTHVEYVVVPPAITDNNKASTVKDKVVCFDEVSNFSYTHVYKNNQLKTAFRVMNGDTIYQITDPNYDFKLGYLQNVFKKFMAYKDYDNALIVNAQGTKLVYVVVNPKGYVVSCSILNNIHPAIDKLVSEFIEKEIYPGTKDKYRFKPYKINRMKQFYEIVIPIEFSVDRLYRRPVKYYNHFHHMHMNNQMNYIRSPQIPSNFGKF